MKVTPKLLLVTGIGRSGTTLLQGMLHAHSQIYSPPETKYLKRYVIPEHYSPDTSDLSVIKERLRASDTLSRLEIDLETLLDKLDATDKRPYLQFYHHLMTHCLKQAPGAHFFADKDPLFINYPAELDQILPQSIMIQIIRDPRDVILSRIKSKWGKDQHFLVHLFETRYGFEQAESLGIQHFKNRFTTISYEELVTDPQTALQQICNYLNIPFELDMLHFHKKSDSILTKEEEDWKGNVRKPVMKGNINKWKKGLSAKQVYQIELVLEDKLTSLDYEVTTLQGTLAEKARQLTLNFLYTVFKLLKNAKKKIG